MSAQDWMLVWSDEFNGKKIDSRKWGFDVDCWGGGNEERQCYTRSARNAVIKDGKLVITARHERTTGLALPVHLRTSSPLPLAVVAREFSSARLTTRGKAAWRYGRVEVNARLPQGQGTWPAIWMLPEKERYGSWAASGEIDILEAVNLGVACTKCPGGRENTILGTLHFGGQWPKNVHKGEEVSFPQVLDQEFHTYAIEWTHDQISWQVDGRTYAVRTAKDWSTSGSAEPGAPFDQPFHLILNLAIGGKLAESRGLGGVRFDDYPKQMEVDWVRIWQKEAGRAGTVEKGGRQ
ncbi:glycoside hydrolase family 16 protein [Aquisediminimonas profunda]|uniref:glycoside hydrolase family 16 protein n=1 Tax=Aquisediminimonas profunda TaxID=1550733 RepID=UPI001FE34C55|nr:glycoside hydrolase family 16 protein [Aquisediminimonas profunda]